MSILYIASLVGTSTATINDTTHILHTHIINRLCLSVSCLTSFSKIHMPIKHTSNIDKVKNKPWLSISMLCNTSIKYKYIGSIIGILQNPFPCYYYIKGAVKAPSIGTTNLAHALMLLTLLVPRAFL